MNGADLIVLLGVGAAVLLAAALLRNRGRGGKGCCGGGCPGCPARCKDRKTE